MVSFASVSSSATVTPFYSQSSVVSRSYVSAPPCFPYTYGGSYMNGCGMNFGMGFSGGLPGMGALGFGLALGAGALKLGGKIIGGVVDGAKKIVGGVVKGVKKVGKGIKKALKKIF